MTQIAKGTVALSGEFARHRITGWVPHAEKRGINPALDVPLVSHVEGGLWQGGCRDGVRLPDEFDYVLSLYRAFAQTTRVTIQPAALMAAPSSSSPVPLI